MLGDRLVDLSFDDRVSYERRLIQGSFLLFGFVMLCLVVVSCALCFCLFSSYLSTLSNCALANK